MCGRISCLSTTCHFPAPASKSVPLILCIEEIGARPPRADSTDRGILVSAVRRLRGRMLPEHYPCPWPVRGYKPVSSLWGLIEQKDVHESLSGDRRQFLV